MAKHSFQISSPSGTLPGDVYLQEDVEYIKFAGQTDYSDINNYKTNQPPEFTNAIDDRQY